MSYFMDDLSALARFNPEKMGKVTLVEGQALMVGLNCFEAGQSHKLHTHASSDKAYLVLSGQGHFTVGEESRLLEQGALVFAPAGVPHGVSNEGPGPLLLLVTMAPPMGRSGT